MKTNLRLLVAACACALALTPAASAGLATKLLSHAPKKGSSSQISGRPLDNHGFRFVPIQFGDFPTIAGDINDRGSVSGQYFDNDGLIHSFLYSNGKCESITYPGATATLVFGLSNQDLIVGNWGTDLIQHAGIYDPRTKQFTQLPDVKNKPINLGARMNERGVILGAACEGNVFAVTNCEGWRWQDGRYTRFTAPGAANGGLGTLPYALNDAGIEVGIWDALDAPFGFHAYYRDGATVIEIKPFGLDHAAAYDINNSGQVLMLAPLDPNAYWQPLVWRAGRAEALPLYPDPAGSHTIYSGINNGGDLAGFWLDADFNPFSFIALRQ